MTNNQLINFGFWEVGIGKQDTSFVQLFIIIIIFNLAEAGQGYHLFNHTLIFLLTETLITDF